MRDLRDVTDSFPGNRVLIGETYLPNVHELEKWYGANHDELQMPMDMQMGFINKLDVNQFRHRINEVEHDIGDNEPLLVFDNHDNPRMDMRYGDGKHDVEIQRMLATILFATRSTAMMYYGDETRDEDHAAHSRGGREGPGGPDGLANRRKAATASARRCSGMARPRLDSPASDKPWLAGAGHVQNGER